MKKSKIISLIIVSLVFIFGGITNVNAAGECDGIGGCRVTPNRGKVLVWGAGGGALYGRNSLRDNTPNYKSSSGSNNGVRLYHDKYTALFCIDPQQPGKNQVWAERFLLSPDSAVSVQAYDMAVMSIASDAGQNAIAASGISGKGYDYFSRQLALRTLGVIFGYHKGMGANVTYQGAYYQGIATINVWMKNAEFKAAYNNLNDALKNHDGTTLNSDFNSRGYGAYGNNEWGRQYITRAMNEAAEFVKNYNTSKPNVTSTAEAMSDKAEEIKDSDGLMYARNVKHTIKVSGLGKGNNFTINKIVSSNDSVNIFIKSIKIGDKLIEEDEARALVGKNLLDLGYDFTNETTIEIIVRMYGWQNYKGSETTKLISCSNSKVSYYIDMTAGKDLYGKYSKWVGIVWYGGEAKAQRYISVEKGDDKDNNNGGTNFRSEYETTLIDCGDCTRLQKVCMESGDLNSEACKEFFEKDCGECLEIEVYCQFGEKLPDGRDACKVYEEECSDGVKCEVSYTPFECCEEKTDTLIVSEADDKNVSIDGPNNINACFVNKIDSACSASDNNCSNVEALDQKENSYALAATNDNKYCTVSCKEDYAMNMPTAKMVNAGRYFTFRARVEGTKTCYTNTINRDEYNKDMIEIQTKLIDTYNEYLKWTTALKNIKSKGNGYCSQVSTSCGEGVSGPCCKSSCNCTQYYVDTNATYAKINYTKNANTGVVSMTGTTNTRLEAYSADGGRSGSGCTSSCTSGSRSTLESNIQKKIDALAKELTNYTEAKSKIIADFNGCSNWNSEINYNPNVYYDYEEDYLEKNNLTGLMDQTLSSINNNDWYCNSNISSNGEETNKAKLSSSKYDSCSISGNNFAETNIGYASCGTNGCEVKNEKISNARYKKQTSKITANYKPKTLFYNIYPSGEITVNKDIPNAKPLENKLPVSLATQRGIYKYTVNIENLGEFYKISGKDNLGRYVGAKSAVIDPKTLVYSCAYLVNIMTTEGWVCDFDQECTDDCISNCVGPGCEGDNYCDGTDCIAECVGAGCIYDKEAGSSLLEKVVSLSNLFPNGTKSYNWNKDANEKAKTTVKAIETKGNKVYEEKPILSITISPSTKRAITDYNKKEEKNGGYSNKTMSCYKLGEYEDAVCYSSFIQDVLDNKYGNKTVNDSKITDSKYRTGTNVDTKSATSSEDTYFKSWTGTLSEKAMIGPSWR